MWKLPKTNNSMGSHSNNTVTKVLQGLSQICYVIKNTIDSLKEHQETERQEKELRSKGIDDWSISYKQKEWGNMQ